MAYTYTWTNADQTTVKREDEEGDVLYIPADEGNRHYRQFVEETKGVADPYVAPPEPAPLTTEEKVDQLLSDYGLSRTELRAVLEEEPVA